MPATVNRFARGIEPSGVTLASETNTLTEITESHSITDLGNAQRQLHELRQLGCLIAVDDFGTGFSTFAYLKQLEADILKIDGSLIQGLPDDPLDRTVIAALTAIAETANKRTIAECVEDPAVLNCLYDCGVDYVQGFAIGMPRLHLSLAVIASEPSRRGNQPATG